MKAFTSISLRLILRCVLPLCAVSVISMAQQTTRGRDFVIAFLPNYHEAGSTSDSLYLSIVATTPTSGSIELRDRSGAIRTRTFSISDPTRILTIGLSADLYELRGYNYRTAFTTANDNENASPASVRITSDHDVAVYALNKAVRSSDATLVLPVACLGDAYSVMSNKSDMQGTIALSTQSTPSQFCVVATENNTDVTIRPSSPTLGKGNAEQRIVLQRGQSYLVQSVYSTANNGGYDLTGTSILSTKPIAVFGGHQRARIGITSLQGSRDHLYEQLLPTSVWGTRYVLTPFVQPAGGWSSGSDKYRVLACQDSTQVFVNGTRVALLNANAVYEADLVSGAFVTATKKICVALFKKTAGLGSSSPGDPFFMIIPPRRQYSKSYRFASMQANGAYDQHFITLTVVTADVPTLRLDGSRITTPPVAIPGSCYSYVSLGVSEGPHSISGSSPFGLYAYGYGDADSYGYVGGMEFIPDATEQVVFAGSDRTVCPGSTTVLSATSGFRSYRWSPSTGLSCDTCAKTVATVSRDTRFVVSAVDSLGCVSFDTVNVAVRKLPVNYALRSSNLSDTAGVRIGASFRLAVKAGSTAWDSILATRMMVTISFDPSFMTPADLVTAGPALPADWSVAIADSLSDFATGRLVIVASGDSALRSDGVFMWVTFRSRLGYERSTQPDIRMSLGGRIVDCSLEQGTGMTIVLATCVESLRNVQLVNPPVTIRSVAPQPVRDHEVSFVVQTEDDALVSLRIFSSLSTCVDSKENQYLQRGEHPYHWSLPGLSSGVYLIVAETDGFSAHQTFIIP